MKTIKLAVLFLIACVLSTVSSIVSANRYEVINNYVAQYKESMKLNSGTAVIFIKDDRIVYESYFGFADIENKISVNQQSPFYVASMTKPFTSLLTLLLAHNGKIDLNQNVADMFPDIKFKRALKTQQVTIRDLLAHTSGIDNFPLVQATAYTGLHREINVDKILAESYVNENAPHGEYDYTNVGYNILSHWLDKKLGTNWQTLLEELIFTPLAMTNASARISDAEKYNWQLPKGYSVKSSDPNEPVYLTKTDNSMHAAGGMIASANDLSRFLIMQLNQGKLDNKQVLPSSVIETSQQKLIPSIGSGDKQQHYGWGWSIRKVYNHTLLEHRGGYSGASTYMSFMPEQNLALIVLSNQDKWGGNLAYSLEDIAYGIALGESEENINTIMAEWQDFQSEAANRFYASKSLNKPIKTATLHNDYLGTYKHKTLGEIQVQKEDRTTVVLHWGNLKSRLNLGDKPNLLSVELIPNRYEDILFLTGTDKKRRLKYQDYYFEKVAN